MAPAHNVEIAFSAAADPASPGTAWAYARRQT
jgi:hypothetical protein